MHKSEPIAIVGAGIAGLTAALCLSQRGFSVDIIEQAGQLSTIGAGLQLSSNATAILTRLGLLPALEAAWTEPDSICLIDGKTLKPLARVPSGSSARKRWNAPYGVLHRASLQRILVESVQQQPLCQLHLGQRLDNTRSETIADITGHTAGLLIGADGVWSSVRTRMPGAGTARFSGNVAFRFTIDRRDAPAVFDPSLVMAFVGPRAHIVAYPLREADTVNIVAIVQGKVGAISWGETASAHHHSELISAFAGWHADLQRLFAQGQPPTFWPLYEVTDGAWQDGTGTVLIGDAAHAMMPFAAQGAAMAIEDAWELAAFLDSGQPQNDALAAFVANRKSRIKKVRARGAFNRFAYHATGPVRIARDFVLSRKRPEDLAADLDWLYGYKASD
ncbi:FAD-dependent oxidoreductase [Rhizobium sp. 32-5/1]|uniref:FAD-dependent oxidoreductase n=1 Tax=Rhizobium sp. 32-5/1 TaxID=3019602 RepID=UPI00240D70E9|nr:FAD-dependent oxidoreductase [Rhizobium sp. 32-5/1]WEZ83600.1 FAD-dependent oxidoreductase [Rhizobium sp. 32-5/1]